MRFVVLIIATGYISTMMSSVLAFNLSIVCMTSNTSSSSAFVTDGVEIFALKERRFVYTTMERGWLFAVIFAGGICGLFPASWLTTRYGTHRVMAVQGFLGSIIAFLIPIGAAVGLPLFGALRFLQGFFMLNIFPLIGSIISQWAPITEHGIFVAFLMGHAQISPLFSMPVSGMLCSSRFGWPFIFYVPAALLFTLFITWTLIYRDNPKKHPFVSAQESMHICNGKPGFSRKSTAPKPPWRRIFRTKPLYAAWLCNVAHFFVSQFAYGFSPFYYTYVLQYTISQAGIIAIVPVIIQFVLQLISGFISDRVKFISETCKLRIFNSLAQYLPALLFIAAAFITPSYRKINTVTVLLASSSVGFNAGGYNKSAVMIARQFSRQIMIVVQVIISATLFSGSFIVTSLTPENTFEQWRLVFLFYAICLIVCNTVFLVYCSAEPADWTKTTDKNPLQKSILKVKTNDDVS